MIDSESTQKSTDEHPRIISYGKNAKTIFAFSGLPSENTIEIIHFDESEKKYKFAELSLTSENKLLLNEALQNCFRCHKGKPIWREYPDWDGALGHNDDLIVSEEDKRELNNLNQKIKEKRSIYSVLKERKVVLSGRRGGVPQPEVAGVPNFKLGYFLYRNVIESELAKIKNLGEYSEFVYTLFFALSTCNFDLEDLLKKLGVSTGFKKYNIDSKTLNNRTLNFVNYIKDDYGLDLNFSIEKDSKTPHRYNDGSSHAIRSWSIDLVRVFPNLAEHVPFIGGSWFIDRRFYESMRPQYLRNNKNYYDFPYRHSSAPTSNLDASVTIDRECENLVEYLKTLKKKKGFFSRFRAPKKNKIRRH